MFLVRKAEEIVQDMIDYTRGQTTDLTDFRVGSKTRTIYEAVATVFEEFYYRMWQGAKALIEDAVYKLFDFGLLPATKAEGNVTFSRNTPAVSDIVIPAGTYITTAGQNTTTAVIYETTETVTLQTGQTSVTVLARALRPGKFSNVSANSLTVMQTTIAGIDSVTNPEAISNGTDQETPDERKNRFRKYIATRAQGTAEALQYAAEQVAGVKTATVRQNPELVSFTYDNSSATYIDNTFEANNPYGVSFGGLPDNPELNDALYFGSESKFDFIYIRLSSTSPATGGSGVWEYWDGAVWKPLTVTDGTNALKNSGTVSFTTPSDWRDSKINGSWQFWIRFRCSASDWAGNKPLIDHIFVAPPPGYVDVYIQDENAEASSQLIADVATALERYRGSGITVNVKAPTKVLVSVVCEIKVDRDYESNLVVERVKQTIIDHLNAFELGQHFILSKLENDILNLDEGRGSMVDSAKITTPALDMLASPNEIFRPADSTSIQVVVVN